MSAEKSNDSNSEHDEQMSAREQMEVRLITLLLGEASDFEKAELEDAMARDPALRKFLARMENTIGVVREVADPKHVQARESYPRLSPKRREELIRKVQPKERPLPVPVFSRRFSLRAMGLAASVVLGLGLFYLLLIRPAYDFRSRKVYEVAAAQLSDLAGPARLPEEVEEERLYSSPAPSLSQMSVSREPERKDMANAVSPHKMEVSLNASAAETDQESTGVKRKGEQPPASPITGALQDVVSELRSLKTLELESLDESGSRVEGEDRDSSSLITGSGAFQVVVVEDREDQSIAVDDLKQGLGNGHHIIGKNKGRYIAYAVDGIVIDAVEGLSSEDVEESISARAADELMLSMGEVTGPEELDDGKATDLELFFQGGFRELNESTGDACMAMGGTQKMRGWYIGRNAEVAGGPIDAGFQFEIPPADRSSDEVDPGHLSTAGRVQVANRSRVGAEGEAAVGAIAGKSAQPREPLQSPELQLASAPTTHAHDARQELKEASKSLEKYHGAAQTYRDDTKDKAEIGGVRLVVNDDAKIPPSHVLAPLPEVQTSDNPFSTFSLNISDVSFKLAAVALERGQLPVPGSIRSEEFVNAFNYHDEAPTESEAIVFQWEYARSPFAFNREVLRFSVQAAATGRSKIQPLNLAVALDNSGSMQRADRQDIVQELLMVLSSELREGDRVSLVAFDRRAHLLADGVTKEDRNQLLDQVRRMQPQGVTHLESGLELAYAQVEKHYRSSANNRVILLTDGAANLGSTDADALSAKVEDHRRQGIALDSFGVGWGDYNDVLLEVLSRRGDGRYGFINSVEEVREGFARKLAGSLRVAAADVKVQVEFNPDRVLAYRQVGYRRHQLRSNQFRDNAVDAAEIGAAEAGNALYVIETREDGRGPLGVVRIRYRQPTTGEVREQSWDLYPRRTPPSLEDATPSMRLAVCAATFAEWLAGSPFADGVEIDQIRLYLADVEDAYPLDPKPARLARMLDQAARLRR